jgi:putative membrane protein
LQKPLIKKKEDYMIGYFLTILVTALALLIVDIIFPGVTIASFPVALLAGVVIGFINAVIKPVLSILSLPITFLTLGLFALIVNGICFWLASILVPGFVVKGALAFLLGPIVLSLASAALNGYLANREIGGSLSPGTTNPAVEAGADKVK